MKVFLIVILFCILINRVNCDEFEDKPCSPNVSRDTLSLVNSLDPAPNASVTIKPGDVLCPSTNLDPPLKQKRIFIGIVGCEIDPLLAFLGEEDEYVYNGTNCSSSLPVSCQVPEYFLVLLETISSLNNKANILPYHQVCLRSIITSSMPDFAILTTAIYEQSIERDDISVVIEMFWSEISSYIQAVLLPFSIPVMSFASSGRFHNIDIETISNILEDGKIETPSNELDIDQIRVASDKYLFTMAPERGRVIELLDTVAYYFGWREVGLVITEESLVDSETHVHTIGGKHASYLVVAYMEGQLLQTFQPFIEKEIEIFIFHGHARLYLRLLYEAAQFDFVNNHTTWIYPYFDIVFPDNYAELWCEFTNEQVVVIKNALRGTILLGLSKGIGTRHDLFIKKYPIKASQVSGSCEECLQPRFIHTFYLFDIMAVMARALNVVVNETAKRLDIKPEDVQLGRDDRKLLANTLNQVQILDSVTGRIQFTSSGKRNAFLFDIRNFVPIYNANFSVETAISENPWVIERRGTVTKEGENTTFTFYTSDGNISSTSTIVFPDGTTNILTDRVVHFYVRVSLYAVLSFSILIFLFLVSVISFLVSIYYADQAALQLSSNGIYSDCDLTYTSGNAGGIHGKMVGYLASSQGQVAKLKKEGHLMLLSPGKFTRSLITKKVFLEISKLRTMVHPNVATLYGCLVGETKAAFLYAHSSRGTLEEVLKNAELELDWVFSLSFGLDAAEGMSYLHSKKVIHGRLDTSACTINEQWALKIKDYGLRELHKQMDIYSEISGTLGKRVKKNRNIPPEIRFFGGKPTYETDVYSYGLVLEELANKSWTNLDGFFKKSLLGTSKIKEEKKNFQNDYFDEYIAPKMKKIVKTCTDASPYSRPAFDRIATNLRRISYLFERKGQSNISMLQIYSRRLEERLGDMGDLMVAERDYSNDVIRSYIPECMIVSKENGELQSLKKLLKAIICIEITNSEFLITKLDTNDFNRVVVLIQKTVEGVLNNYNMNQLHTSGTSWTITSIEDANVRTIQNAICAAQSLFESLKDIPIPGYPDLYPTARAGLHAGDIFCGVVEQPIPKVVCFGINICTALQLMLSSKDGRILATSKLMPQTSMEEHLTARSYIAMEIDNELMTTMWVEVPMMSSRGSPLPPLKLMKLGSVKCKQESKDLRTKIAGTNLRRNMMRPFSDTGRHTAPSLRAIPPLALSPSRAIFSDHSGTDRSQ